MSYVFPADDSDDAARHARVVRGLVRPLESTMAPTNRKPEPLQYPEEYFRLLTLKEACRTYKGKC